jgi:hypothetical protein
MFLKYYLHKNNIFFILTLITSLLLTYIFSSDKYQGALPYYLSASLNDINLSAVAFSVEETLLFENYMISNEQGNLPFGNIQNYFKFNQKTGSPATTNEIISRFGYVVSVGFLLYLKFLRMCFSVVPYIGDIPMIMIGNAIIHICCCFAYLKLTPNLLKKSFFTLFYFFNPLIIVIYTFPYYYYLLILPSMAAIYIYQNKFDIKLSAYIIIFIILLFTMFVRPTVTPGILCICLITALLHNSIRNWIAFGLMIGFVALFFINYQLIFGPWHTIYIGVGAYANDFAISLKDQSSKDFLMNSLSIDNEAWDNHYINFADKINLLKSEVLRLIILDPMQFIQNAFKNVLHLYGFGYSDDIYWFRYISMPVGALFLLLLIKKKLYFHVIVIFFLNVGYILYFPPIPMYMAGTYILLIHGWLEIFLKTWNNFSLKQP